MGWSTGIECKNCGYYKNFMLGTGMLDCKEWYLKHRKGFYSLEMLTESNQAAKKIFDLIDNKGAVIADNFERRIYRCPTCGEFYNNFFIHLDYPDGSYEVEYHCPKCKALLQPFQISIRTEKNSEENDNPWNPWQGKSTFENYPCPQCGKYTLFETKDTCTCWD